MSETTVDLLHNLTFSSLRSALALKQSTRIPQKSGLLRYARKDDLMGYARVLVRSDALNDNDGKTVFTLNKGDTPVAVTLASGKYSLTLISDSTKPEIIFMMPDSCVTGTTSAQSSRA